MAGALRGRVLWRRGEAIGLRAAEADHVVEPAGEAQPGDLVEVAAPGEAPRVVRRSGGRAFPDPAGEVARLPRARLGALAARARATRAVRAWFDRAGFLEVDAPLRVRTPGLEVHLDPVAADGGWLTTSPEYQMKRLLAGGLERIYAVCRCSRAGETGPHHQPEFTMIEWYRGWAELDEVLADTEQLVAAAAEAVRGTTRIEIPAGAGDAARTIGRTIDLAPPWRRMTVGEAMERWAGVALEPGEDAGRLRERLVAAGIDPGAATGWDDLFYTAFLERVEPELAALDTPIVLLDWPVELAALARRAPGRPGVVERFEAYVAGIELCNAFGELTDPAEQRARFEEDLRRRAARGAAVPPIDERLIAALEEGLPPSAGNALGLDRLVMLLTGAREIRQVSWFTDDEL